MADRVMLVKEEPRGPSQLIEVLLNTADIGTSKKVFPDVQQLRSLANQRIIITAMRLITLDVLTFAPISGFANATLAELKKIVLVIYCEGWEKAQYIPLLTMNDVATPAGTFPYRNNATKFSNWQNVDWSKTYLLYCNGTGGVAGAPYAIMFDVEYIKLDADGQVIIGPS
jgi:hypothetical protein